MKHKLINSNLRTVSQTGRHLKDAFTAKKQLFSGLFLTRLFLAVMISAFVFISATAQIKLPGIIGSNMVLQQKAMVPIWGWTTPGKTVQITTSWNVQRAPYMAKTDNKGYWRVVIQTPGAGGPYAITIDDGQPRKLTNILIGEVWICSGQSNMEISMKGFTNMPILNANDILTHASIPELRLYHVPRKLSADPVISSDAKWEVSTPGAAAAFSAVGFQFARMLQQILQVPVGIIESSYGGSTIQAWIDPATIKGHKTVAQDNKVALNAPLNRHSPGALYNGMLNPILGFGIKGVLWYQGASNWKEPSTYKDYFKTFVAQWRRDWHNDEMPFYYVQIAPYQYHPAADSAPLLRAAQAAIEKEVPHTGMVVSVDVGERDVIHPADKTTIAKRLLYWALGDSYQLSGIDYRSPTFQTLRVEKDTAFVHFDNARRGLTTYGKAVASIEIAGTDQVFYPAESLISPHEKGTLVVFSKKVPRPVAVRYAFHAAAPGNLYNTQGLPVAPFRTDHWPSRQMP